MAEREVNVKEIEDLVNSMNTKSTVIDNTDPTSNHFNFRVSTVPKREDYELDQVKVMLMGHTVFLEDLETLHLLSITDVKLRISQSINTVMKILTDKAYFID